MATDRIVAGVAGSTAAPTSETAVATLAAGANPGAGFGVIVRADLPLIGTTSVTSVTVRIRRGPTSGLTGAVIATCAVTTGVNSFGASAAFYDTAYDGTGYVLSVQAAGAAATCGPGLLEAQLVPIADTWGAG